MIEEHSSQLLTLLRSLALQWAEVRTNWDDTTTAEFEETYVLPLSENVTRVVRIMDNLRDAIEESAREKEGR